MLHPRFSRESLRGGARMQLLVKWLTLRDHDWRIHSALLFMRHSPADHRHHRSLVPSLVAIRPSRTHQRFFLQVLFVRLCVWC